MWHFSHFIHIVQKKRSASSHVQANCWCQKLRLGIPSVRQWICKIAPEIESEVLRVNVRF